MKINYKDIFWGVIITLLLILSHSPSLNVGGYLSVIITVILLVNSYIFNKRISSNSTLVSFGRIMAMQSVVAIITGLAIVLLLSHDIIFLSSLKSFWNFFLGLFISIILYRQFIIWQRT